MKIIDRWNSVRLDGEVVQHCVFDDYSEWVYNLTHKTWIKTSPSTVELEESFNARNNPPTQTDNATV